VRAALPVSELWAAVDDYVEHLFEPRDRACGARRGRGDSRRSGAGDAAAARRPFDFTFIDADKFNTAEYFAWAMRPMTVMQTVGRKKYDGFAVALCTMATPP